MIKNVLAPTVGESISEVRIANWLRKSGESVKTGDILLEIESDKATVEVIAETNGVLNITVPAGETVAIGAILGSVDDSASPSVQTSAATPKPVESKTTSTASSSSSDTSLSPAVRKLVAENSVNPSQISGSGKDGRLTKGDVLEHLSRPASTTPSATTTAQSSAVKSADRPGVRRVTMTTLRARIAQRLVEAQHTAAILTTFNEADMTQINEIRAKHKDRFKAKHGVSLGFMSFFTRAAVEALKQIPEVNAYIEGNEVLYHDYYNVGIAVGSEKGLVVPVVKNAEKKNFVEIEKEIASLAVKARDGKLSIADMTDGTFTISNGGVYGSLMSTPILNPPQSGILGMHKTQERPVAINGKVEIRPMMYLALSYDHRIIDGKGAVTFLVILKDYIENPQKIGLEFLNEL